MGRKLKVAFAMGGGASLGAFSGGAMAEVLHQLHTNLDRATWDSVEIDVLSGASAGGMTLGLLVRGLADPGNDSEAAAVERVRTCRIVPPSSIAEPWTRSPVTSSRGAGGTSLARAFSRTGCVWA